MSDYQDSDFTANGYYRIWYGRVMRPWGPYASVAEMAEAVHMHDYPDDGYVVYVEDEGMSNIPSLNPDDLLPCEDEHLVLPMPGETFDGSTVIASSWSTDEYDGGKSHDLSLAELLLLNPGSPYYRLVQIASREDDAPVWTETIECGTFPNIIPAAQAYSEAIGGY